jgi:hypothetical protein
MEPVISVQPRPWPQPAAAPGSSRESAPLLTGTQPTPIPEDIWLNQKTWAEVGTRYDQSWVVGIHWTLGFADVTLRLLGSDDFAPAVKADAAAWLTAALVDGSLRVLVTKRLPLEEVAEAHELVERGHTGRVILQLL